MADHEQRTRIQAQPVLQPYDGIQIKVIGGFIKQQHIGAAHQRLGKCQAYPPAAGELRHCAPLIPRAKAKPGEQLRGAGCGRVATNGLKLRVQVGELVAIIQCLGTCELALQRPQLGIPIQDEFERGPRIGLDFLRDAGQHQVARQIKLATIRRQFAADQRQQARLAGAIGTDNADFLGAVEAEGRLGEQHACAPPQADISKADHSPIVMGKQRQLSSPPQFVAACCDRIRGLDFWRKMPKSYCV